MDREPELSFGAFKPVGHVVISLPTSAQADAAAQALVGLGLAVDAIRRYTNGEMLAQIDHDLARASPLADIGQDLNLIKAHRALAAQGYHWLVVRAVDDEQAAQVAQTAKSSGAETAQYYGYFIIEELIEHAADLPQVAESPARGLDTQTPSADTAERARERPAFKV